MSAAHAVTVIPTKVTYQRSAYVIPTKVGISSGTVPTAVPTFVGTTDG